MAWIESHQELARHPKTKRLAREIDENVRSAIGLLHLLWWWAMDYAQDGDLTRFEPEDIADGMMWDGEPPKLISALINSGFVDENEDETVTIHDWDEYAGRLIDKRKDNAERKKKSRARHKDVTQTSQGSHGATNTTQPTQPNQQQQPTKMSLSLDKYCDEIQFEMIANGVRSNYVIQNNDYENVKSFHASEIPIEFLKECITFAFSKKKDIKSFAYIAEIVKSKWAHYQARAKPAELVDFSAYIEVAATKEIRHGPYVLNGMPDEVAEFMRAREEMQKNDGERES